MERWKDSSLLNLVMFLKWGEGDLFYVVCKQRRTIVYFFRGGGQKIILPSYLFIYLFLSRTMSVLKIPHSDGFNGKSNRDITTIYLTEMLRA